MAGGELQMKLLTVDHYSHLRLEVIVGELPEGKGLPGRVLQHPEGDADGVLWRETCRVDKPERMLFLSRVSRLQLNRNNAVTT